jgi:hypothetical protein
MVDPQNMSSTILSNSSKKEVGNREQILAGKLFFCFAAWIPLRTNENN